MFSPTNIPNLHLISPHQLYPPINIPYDSCPIDLFPPPISLPYKTDFATESNPVILNRLWQLILPTVVYFIEATHRRARLIILPAQTIFSSLSNYHYFYQFRPSANVKPLFIKLVATCQVAILMKVKLDLVLYTKP